MSDPTPFLSVGYHKSKMDFSVCLLVTKLSYEEMKNLREMTIVGIGVMEQMWRDSRQQPQAHQAKMCVSETRCGKCSECHNEGYIK